MIEVTQPSEQYVVSKSQAGWSVWDRCDGTPLATFRSAHDADVCRAACEMVRRARPAHPVLPDEEAERPEFSHA